MAAGLHDDNGRSGTQRCDSLCAIDGRILSRIKWVGLCVSASPRGCRPYPDIPGCDGWHGCWPLHCRGYQRAIHTPVHHKGSCWPPLRSHGHLRCGRDDDLYGSPVPEAADLDSGFRLAELRNGLSPHTLPCAGDDSVDGPCVSRWGWLDDHTAPVLQHNHRIPVHVHRWCEQLVYAEQYPRASVYLRRTAERGLLRGICVWCDGTG
jgi:hypothetical protein